MKTLAFLLAFALSLPCFAGTAHPGGSNPDVPAQGEFGLGVMVGTIVSATGKYWITDRAAIDFGIGIVGAPWFATYADFLWHIPKIFGTGTKWGRESNLYFGGGGGLAFWDNRGTCGHWSCDWNDNNHDTGTAVFLRGVAGVEWYPIHTRFGVFGELGPTILVSPGMWATADIAVGGRYYF